MKLLTHYHIINDMFPIGCQACNDSTANIKITHDVTAVEFKDGGFFEEEFFTTLCSNCDHFSRTSHERNYLSFQTHLHLTNEYQIAFKKAQESYRNNGHPHQVGKE